jgi:hypothetical protein
VVKEGERGREGRGGEEGREERERGGEGEGEREEGEGERERGREKSERGVPNKYCDSVSFIAAFSNHFLAFISSFSTTPSSPRRYAIPVQ